MAKQIATGSSLGLHYEIYDRTGMVDQSETRSETEVEGSVSGGGGFGGYTAPVVGSTTSRTTRFQNIFLTDDEGKEHAVELTNFLVTCRPGQKLTMFLLTHGKHERGSYFKALNRNTRETFDHPKAIRSEMYPWRSFLIAMGVLVVLFFINLSAEAGTSSGEALFYTAVATLIVGAPVWFIGWLVSAIRSMAVRKNRDFKAHLTKLNQQQVSEDPHHIEGSAAV